ncbi:MAG: NAD-dependent malic enzyme [Nitrospira sp.]|nr:NAD-dependent malic enzyme [Nitrospira sp.]
MRVPTFKVTVRVALDDRPGVFAQVAAALAAEGANLGAVDMVTADGAQIVRDITFEVQNETQRSRATKRLQSLPNVRLLPAPESVFEVHEGGKIGIQNKVPVTSHSVLSFVYTPGVGRVAAAIAQDPAQVYTYTIKRNAVAVVTDGSAVLGLGNLGPEAALPVMEGKVMLFKELAGIDAWPICLKTQNVDEIVRAVEHIAPGFGGINLEDISAPRCFEIERRLRLSLDIPVMHDDQHGTAVVILAGLLNAVRVTQKKLEDIRVVVNGLGAAGVTCCQMLLKAGVRHIIGCGRQGIILAAPPQQLFAHRENLTALIDRENPKGSRQDALHGADVFVGLSSANLLTPEDLALMASDRIVFAMANPDPEITPELAVGRCRVFATGRSDYPNQINNALAFPGMFRGALDVRATEINDAMKMAAAHAIARIIPADALSADYIIPSVFDRQVVPQVAQAVAQAARDTGVARKQ